MSCKGCKNPPKSQSHSYCQRCIDQADKRRQSAFAKGLCKNCYNSPVKKGFSKCERCILTYRERKREKIAERFKLGLCIKCKDPVDDLSYKKCSRCRRIHTDYMKKWHQRRTVNGLVQSQQQSETTVLPEGNQ